MKLRIYLILIGLSLNFFSLFNQASAQISKEGLKQMESLILEKNSRTPVQRKIDSRLLQAFREKSGMKMAPGVDLLPANVNADKDGMLKVDITGNITEALLSKIQMLGGKIIYPSFQYHTLRAEINLSQVEQIAALPEVKFIEPAIQAQTEGSGYPDRNSKMKLMFPNYVSTATGNLKSAKLSLEERAKNIRVQLENYLKKFESPSDTKKTFFTGSVNSQGDRTHRADDVRNTYGYAGQGIKIGVMSDSYNATGGAPADVTSGNLPGTGNPLGNTTPVTVLADNPGSTDEGRAMMQIVHDLAPKAQLFFATAYNSPAAFATNIQALRSAGCDIIIDDIFYFNEPAFQDGIIAQAVNAVTAGGALYFSSAGNSGSVLKGTAGVYEGDFNDAGSLAFTGATGKTGTIHNFGTVAAPVNGDIVKTAPATTSAYFLKWADPMGASANDYDLFLISSAGTIKASSTNIQNGTQDPYESFAPPTLVAGDRLVVYKTAAAAVRAFHLNANRGTLTVVTKGQTHGHSAAANSFSVAATPASGPYPAAFSGTNTVETFSSDGPRRIFYNPDGTPVTAGNFLFGTNGGTVRLKPDITAADGVSTTLPGSSGLNPFFGTSAAAPHAGAIAALLKSANPALTTNQVRNLLITTAVDIEAAGYDSTSGYGILQAFQAMQVLAPTPMASLNIGTVTATEGSFKNGNGSIEPGETGNLSVQLNNSTTVNATSVTATVTTSTPGVTIINGNSSYGTINANSSAVNATPFTFAVNSNVGCGSVINFVITATYTGGSLSPQAYPFSITLGTPQTSPTISSTLGNVPPNGTGYTVISGQQTGRIGRFGIPSTCASNNGDPGINSNTGARQFDAYTFTNTGATQCISVTFNNSNPTNIFCAAYNKNGFVPTSPLANYLAQSGTPSNTTFNVNVPAGEKFTLVVHEVTTGSATGANATPYTLSVTMAGCAAAPACTPVTITPTTIANGATGTPYTQTFTASGGGGNYSYSLSGDLPAGLTFAGNTSTATLSGTPTQAGSFPITITANDLTGCPAGTMNYTLVISGIAPASVTATTGTPQTAPVCSAFTTELQATVRDAGNNTLGGVNVKFTAPTSGASGTFSGGVTTITVVTNSSGIATALFTANSTLGSYSITASVTGVGTVATFNLTNSSILVTSNADNGAGTLRDAINNACPGAIITIPASITQINLTSGELLITNSLTINGPGANVLTISGGNLSRVLHINPATATSTINVSGITFRDGKVPASSAFSGAGVYIEAGIVNINGCVISNNDATAPSGNGDGGGILNSSTGVVTIDRSSIINNKSDRLGGGICQFGTGALNITNSTISGNRSTGTLSGVGYGGGLFYGTSTTVSMTNCTVFADTAFLGGNINKNGSGNVLTFKNTIIAAGVLLPTGGAGPDIYNTTSGGAVSTDYNLIQNTSNAVITGTTSHNITGVSPNLLPLANNGGPTPTLLPAANSPVINTGDPALTSGTDQRGLARLVGPQADMGSVEAAYVFNYYYSKSTGNLELLTTWGTNTDGSGNTPPNFTSDNQVFNVRNNQFPFIANDWTVGGLNSSILVGDGTTGVALGLNNSKIFTINNSVSLLIQNSSSMLFLAGSRFNIGTGASANFNNKPVTFNSTGIGTAALGQILGTLSNANSVSVERYIPANANKAWRLLSIPTITSQTINAAWQNGQAAGVQGIAGSGTMITSNNGNATFDFQTPGNSMLTYNAGTNAWAGIANTTAAIGTDNGYMLFVRGDRTATPANGTKTATTLRTLGTVKQGNYPATPLSVTGGQFGLIGNPYISQIDFRNVTKSAGIDNTFYVWDPKLSGPNGVGGYQTLTLSGSNYIIMPGGGSYGSPASTMNTIESGQAFFVRASTTGTVSFTESAKSVGNNNVFRTTSTPAESLITNLYSSEAQGNELADGNMILFNNSYSNRVDGNDALKLTNFGLNFGMVKDGNILAVEKRSGITENDVIVYDLTNTKQQTYIFEFIANGLDKPGLDAFLVDNYLKTNTPVNLDGKTTVSFAVNGDAASSAADRFKIMFNKSSIVSSGSPSIGIYPNPVQNGVVTLQMNNMPKGTYSIRLVNSLGQTILRKEIFHAEGTSTEKINVNKINGAYMLEITKPDNSKQANKIIIN